MDRHGSPEGLHHPTELINSITSKTSAEGMGKREAAEAAQK